MKGAHGARGRRRSWSDVPTRERHAKHQDVSSVKFMDNACLVRTTTKLFGITSDRAAAMQLSPRCSVTVDTSVLDSGDVESRHKGFAFHSLILAAATMKKDYHHQIPKSRGHENWHRDSKSSSRFNEEFVAIVELSFKENDMMIDSSQSVASTASIRDVSATMGPSGRHRSAQAPTRLIQKQKTTAMDVRKKHMCPLCPFSTHRANALTIHQRRIHTKDRPFKCDQCPYATSDACDLQKHQRIHSGLRPFQCNQCSFSAAHSSDLTAHRRTHTGEKPYKCELCPFAAARSSDLTVHRRVHTGERPYPCPSCSYAAATSGSLRKHQRYHGHGGITTDNTKST